MSSTQPSQASWRPALGAVLAVVFAGAFAPLAIAQVAAGGRQASDNFATTDIGQPSTRACRDAVIAGSRSSEAVQDCTTALERERPSRANRAAILVNRGALHLRRQEGPLALADFEAALEINPRNAEAQVNRGAALLMVGRPGPAVSVITEALQAGVREPYKAYYTRGAAREALGDLRGAYEDYSTALEIHPEWAPAEQELARFVRSRRDRLAAVFEDPTSAPPAAPTNGAATQPAGGLQ